MYIVIILVSNLLGFIYGTYYFQEIIPKTEDLNGKTYIYVNSSMTWNDAKRVCMDLGGDLAKTDRQSIIEIFKDLKEHEWSALTTDVWVGLIEPVNGTRLWVDCDEWKNGNWNNFANDTYNDYHQCYKLRATSDWKWESTLCWEKYHFICEKNKTANCAFRDRHLPYDTVLFDLNETECSLTCMISSDCWAVMWNDTSKMCHHMMISKASSLSKFKVKICYTGETHTASAPCREDNSLIPNNSCILPTPSSIIAIGTKRKMLESLRLKEDKSCQPGSTVIIASEFHCAQYFDCTDTNHTSPYPRVNECPFPNLFDRASEKCLQPELVKCDTRFEPKEPCEYLFNQCRESNCVPCRVRFGSCRNSPDGPNAWIGREFSPFFVVCKGNRVLYQDSCPHDKEPYMFHPTLRRCVPAWPLAGNMKMYMKP